MGAFHVVSSFIRAAGLEHGDNIKSLYQCVYMFFGEACGIAGKVDVALILASMDNEAHECGVVAIH